jgi:hypothetical protein
MMTKRIGLALTLLTMVGIGYVGVEYLTAPTATAPSFVGASEPRPDAVSYLGNAKGIRDLFFAVIIVVLLVTRQRRALGWFMTTVSMVPFGDMTIVLAHHGSKAMALGVHGATAAAVLAAGLLILRTDAGVTNVTNVTAAASASERTSSRTA